jgi:hypothetical protein
MQSGRPARTAAALLVPVLILRAAGSSAHVLHCQLMRGGDESCPALLCQRQPVPPKVES